MKAALRTLAAMAAFALTAPVASAEQGVTENSVTFAQVAAFEGPAAPLGLGMRAGIEAAFAQVNREGGVHGRQIFLDTFDDGYEPEQSAAQATKVVQGDDHLALIGPVGTPTTLATFPIAAQARMPYIGAYTGAGFLRDPKYGVIYNLRPAYSAESEEFIRYLADQQGMTRIAIFYQDDGLGLEGLARIDPGILEALAKRGLEPVAVGSYARNTTDIGEALETIRAADPEAVVIFGAIAPVATFIKTARATGFNPTFVNISFVNSRALSQVLGPDGEGVIVGQVVPFPLNSSIPLVADYQSALLETGMTSALSFTSLEGYIIGRFVIETLKTTGPDLTRDRFLAALARTRELDLGGIPLSFDEGDNQGSDDVFLTRITESGSVEAVATETPG